MQESQPHFLLTIAIPTYNRHEALARLLKQLVPQLTPEIEVVIRDDSDTDKTQDVVTHYFRGHEQNLSYHRGKKLGMDRATLFVVENSRGKYVWTFGDDDEMASGAIEKVTKLVRQHPDISFIWANYICPGVSILFDIFGEERFFKDGNEAFELLTNKITLLSTFIFKKEAAMVAWPIAQKHIGSWWSIMALVLESMAGEGRVYYLRGPYVINHLEEHGASGFELGVQVFGINLLLVFREFKGRFKNRSFRKFFSKHFGDVWRGILVNRACYGVELIRSGIIKKLFIYYWSYPEFWVALPFLFMPRRLEKICYQTYKKFF